MGRERQKRLVARCFPLLLAPGAAQAAYADPAADAQPAATGPESTTPHIPRPAQHNLPEAIDASLVYTFDIWHNASGGLRRGTRYLDNLDLTVKVDADRAFGWHGATLFIYGLYNNGVGMSRSLVGNFQDSSNIEEILRGRGLDTVLITGTVTNVCCESTARDAMMLNYKVIFLSDANAANSDAEHNATLATVLRVFGDVVSTDEAIGLLGAAKARVAAE